MEVGDIKLLADLLNPKVDADSDDELPNTDKQKISTKLEDEKDNKDEIEKKEKKKVTEQDYEDFYYDENGEIALQQTTNSRKDWKVTPKWDISYRQQVSASDVFLQMGGKNPSTASCENMIVKINLPGESRQNIDLKVHKQQLQVESPKFYLDIPLPHPVDPQRGNAQFDNDNQQLVIVLVMDREFDFINF